MLKSVPDLAKEEEIRERIAEARQLSVSAPVLVPMLLRRKNISFQRLLAAHRDGKHPDQNAIAELFVIESIINEVNAKLADLNLGG